MSQARTKEKTIDDVTFRVSPLSVEHGRDAQVRLLRVFGPALGELVEGGAKRGAARAFSSLADRLSTQDLTWFCTRFGEKTEARWVDAEDQTERVVSLKEPAQHDQVFMARYDLMFAWLEFCLEVNFAGFFETARKTFEDAMRPATPSLSQSPRASTGKSGA